jgi:YfiH family protein
MKGKRVTERTGRSSDDLNPDPMFRLKKKDLIQYLESDTLKACSFVTHGFLTRWGGVSKGKFSSLNFSTREGAREIRVVRNWDIFAAAFGLSPSRFLMMNQIHGDRIVVADDLDSRLPSDRPIQCDAVLTASHGLIIGIKTADCVPILLVDQVKRVIGAVHAGWRGTSLGIAARAVHVLMNRFSSRPEDILAAIGPAIGACCYQVDERVLLSRKGDPDWGSAFQGCEEKGKWMLDLPLANRLQLMKAGIPPGNIVSAGFCTACRTDFFFSHRAEKGGTGRQLNFIVLKESSRQGQNPS